MADFVSGSDILSNPGNAGLGYGAGVAYNGNPAVINPLQSVDDNMRALHNEDFQRNMEDYHQKIKDRDEVYSMLAKGLDLSGNDPNAAIRTPDGGTIRYPYLDGDKEGLQASADKIRQLTIDNPHIQTDRSKMSELQSALSKFDSDKKIGQARSWQATQQRMAIASEMDPDKRKSMQDHLDSELALPGHVPDPFMQPLSYDPAIVSKAIDVKPIGDPTYERDANGVPFKSQKVGTDAAAFRNVADYVPGTPLFNHTNAQYGSITSSKGFNDNFVNTINDNLSKINADTGKQPGDQDYFNPIGQVNSDGTVVPNPNKRDFAHSLHAAQKYIPSKVTREIAKDYQGATTAYADQKQTESKTINDQQKAPYEIQKLKAEADKAEADAANARDKNDPTAEKIANDKLQALSPVKQVFETYADYNKQSKFVPAEDVISKLPTSMRDAVTRTVRDLNGTDLAQLPVNEEGVASILSRPLHDKIDKTKIIGIQKPTRAFLIRLKSGEPIRMVGIYDSQTEGSTAPEVISVDKKESVNRFIDYQSKFAGGDKALDQKNASQALYDEFSKGGAAQPAAQRLSAARSATPAKRDFVNPASIADADVRQNGGATEVRVNGVWRKAVGRDKNSGSVIVE